MKSVWPLKAAAALQYEVWAAQRGGGRPYYGWLLQAAGGLADSKDFEGLANPP